MHKTKQLRFIRRKKWSFLLSQLSVTIKFIFGNIVGKNCIGFIDLHMDNYYSTDLNVLDFVIHNENDTIGLRQSESIITDKELELAVIKKGDKYEIRFIIICMNR